jgi:ribosome biogenesis protein Nip4
MRLIARFVARFGTSIGLDRDQIVKKANTYFLLNEDLKPLVKKGFFYAGVYLGKVRGETFFPSFSLLAMIAQTDANKVTVDGKTEWLFICGRDVFKRGIVDVSKPLRKGDYTLVMNEHGECLGYGRLLHNVGRVGASNAIVVRNIADVGDFLRREM